MTEDEAKTKWCPFVRLVEGGTEAPDPPVAHNRYSVDGDTNADTLLGTGLYCVASDCMAWRWADRSKSSGYCGLAGRPE